MEGSNYPYAELVRALLKHLDNDKKTFINRISELLSLRDQWMISFFDKFENIKEHLLDNTHKEKLEKIYTELIEKHLTKTFHLFPESLKTPLINFGGYAGKNLNIYDSENPITALSELNSFPNPKFKQLNQWKGISNFLLTFFSSGHNEVWPGARKLSRVFSNSPLAKPLTRGREWKRSSFSFTLSEKCSFFLYPH